MKASILIVDDVPANIRLLAEMLKQNGYEVRPTSSATRALASAQAHPPDVILLDVNMPEINGYEFCLALKEHDHLKDIPVIFVSALGDNESILKGFEVGGVDYISKPFNSSEVLARVNTHLELERRRQEVERLRQREVAQLTQINELKDEILRMASHDLKNPLNVIQVVTEYLLSLSKEQWQKKEADIETMLRHVLDSAEQMTRLITSLLDLARTEGQLNLHLETIPIGSCVSPMVDSFIMMAQKKDIALIYEPTSEVAVFVQIDIERFSQVLQNLLSNAIKYTPPGGRVTITTRATDEEVIITISDTGIGIPSASLPHLFDKFYRINTQRHQQQEGTGLGLAIAKTLTEQHKGRITAESEEEKGSVFTVTLPRFKPVGVVQG